MSVWVPVGLAIASVLAGCGRLGFDAHGDAPTPTRDAATAIDAMVDAGVDGAPTADCWASWHTGVPSLGSVVKLTAIDTVVSDERDPSISDDGLTLYFTSGVAAASSADEMLYATRATPSAPWTLVGSIAAFDSSDVSKLAIADGDSEVVISAAYGSGTTEDLWTGKRASDAAAWDAPSATYTDALNTPNH